MNNNSSPNICSQTTLALGLTSLSFIGLNQSLLAEKPSDGNQKPNFIIVLMDDMGYGDISAYGSKINPTPNMDKLAKEGMKLTNFYSAPLSSASRAQLLTGCFNKRVDIPDVLFASSGVGLSPDEKTIATLLKPQGYTTMMVGKWHLGDQPIYLPTNHGFDHYLGLPYSNNMNGNGIPDKKGKIMPPLPLIQDLKVIEAPVDATKLTRRYTEEVVKFIGQQKDKPFFLYLAHLAVHGPLQPGAEFVGKSGHGLYSDWIAEADWSLGQLMEALKQAKLDENALVIFTSDNGSVLGENGGSNAPFRGSKYTTWEGGMHSPALMWWPKKIQAGSTNPALMSELDILPTLVKLAGGKVPTDRKMDGFDMWPVLSGQTKTSPRELVYYWLWGSLQAVRDGSWKMVIASQKIGHAPKDSQGIKEDKDAEVLASLETPRLYNLDQDPGETTDVAASNPEVIKKLMVHVNRMSSDLGLEKTRKKNIPPGVRTHEPVANPSPLVLNAQEYK